MSALNHLSLFNGIGGFQLAAHWCGWNNVAHVEIDPFCNKVVAYHFPESQCFTDIKQFDGNQFRWTIDIISGGFPCQPYSTAGKRKGKEDERHLWPEMLRTIREVQPEWVVGENVFGLINWNGGMVFDEVQADLEAAGYEVQAYVLPACAVNAPHERIRIWLVANSNSFRRSKILQKDNFKECNVSNKKWTSNNVGSLFDIFIEERSRIYESGIFGTDDGFPYRMDRLKSLGNAIVPQVAFQIFKAISQYNDPTL